MLLLRKRRKTIVQFRGRIIFSNATNNLATEPRPPSWVEGKLTNFIDQARHNIFATFVQLRPYFDSLSQVDLLFREVENAVQPLPEEETIPASFLGRAYGCYLAAVRLSTSGQLTEAYLLLRGCLENALYAFLIKCNQELEQVWLNRHKSEESKEETRNKFRIGPILALLKQKDPETGRISQKLYETTIDFGAHPNERSVSTNLEFIRDGKREKCRLRLLNTDQFFMKACLIINAQVGLCSLFIFKLIYPVQFEQAKIPQKLLHLNDRLRQLV